MMKKLVSFLIFSILSFGYSFMPSQIMAEENQIKVNPQTDLAIKITTIINYAIGVGGFIAFILIVTGGFQIILSGGNPDKVKVGKEIITSAIAGLMLIIFSIFILKLIGYDILDLPGFGYMSWGETIN